MDKSDQHNESATEQRLNNALNERLGRIWGQRSFLLGSTEEEVKANQISWVNTYWGHEEDKNKNSNHIGQ